MFNLLNKKIGKKNKKGFTLIELVVVIAIVAVLAAVGIPAIAGQVKKSQDAAALDNAKLIATTASQMLSENETSGGLVTFAPDIAAVMNKAGIDIKSCDSTKTAITYTAVLDPADNKTPIGMQVATATFVAKNGNSTGKFERPAPSAGK
ncbi:MAG: prepilin-type N-terminal cleavage/methylation domain-containing protein [Oscillospiraceae bacterium]